MYYYEYHKIIHYWIIKFNTSINSGKNFTFLLKLYRPVFITLSGATDTPSQPCWCRGPPPKTI
jgi:hypothetical protein